LKYCGHGLEEGEVVLLDANRLQEPSDPVQQASLVASPTSQQWSLLHTSFPLAHFMTCWCSWHSSNDTVSVDRRALANVGGDGTSGLLGATASGAPDPVPVLVPVLVPYMYGGVAFEVLVTGPPA
jgi:hypothetical protein